MTYLNEILDRIADYKYTQEDLWYLAESLWDEKLEWLRESLETSVSIRGNRNLIQQGDGNISLVIDGINYDEGSLEKIAQIFIKYIENFKIKSTQTGFKESSTISFKSNNIISTEIISYRHLTGLNEYPVLAFLEPTIPKKLITILDLEKTPIIYSDSMVMRSIEKFRDETGNKLLVSLRYNIGVGLKFAINDTSRTKKSMGINMYHDDGKYDGGDIEIEEISQSSEDAEDEVFENYTDTSIFEYAPVYTNFQYSDCEIEWTSITEDESGEGGVIFQYPELSRLSSYKNASSIFKKPCIKDNWILKIIKNNPNTRGLLLFEYRYIKKYDTDYFLFEACSGGVIDIQPITSATYLRFVEIKNVSLQDIKIENLTFKIVEKKDYELTIVDDRDRKILDGDIREEKINLRLPPQVSLIIPIEFGFDTKEHYNQVMYRINEPPENFDELTKQSIYVRDIPSKISSLTDFVEDIKNKNIDLYNVSSSQINPLITQEVNFSIDHLENMKSADELLKSVPRRFAVGTFMDVISLRIDGEETSIDSPSNIHKFTLSAYFGYGSCPYLLVYNPIKGYWKELGNILYGVKHKKLQKSEIYNLGDHVTKIKIEEREPEITYLKSLEIIYVNLATNTKEEIPLNLSDLTRQEKGYFLLVNGQSIEIDLQKNIPLTAEKIQLRVTGYYEILE